MKKRWAFVEEEGEFIVLEDLGGGGEKIKVLKSALMSKILELKISMSKFRTGSGAQQPWGFHFSARKEFGVDRDGRIVFIDEIEQKEGEVIKASEVEVGDVVVDSKGKMRLKLPELECYSLLSTQGEKGLKIRRSKNIADGYVWAELNRDRYEAGELEIEKIYKSPGGGLRLIDHFQEEDLHKAIEEKRSYHLYRAEEFHNVLADFELTIKGGLKRLSWENTFETPRIYSMGYRGSFIEFRGKRGVSFLKDGFFRKYEFFEIDIEELEEVFNGEKEELILTESTFVDVDDLERGGTVLLLECKTVTGI